MRVLTDYLPFSDQLATRIDSMLFGFSVYPARVALYRRRSRLGTIKCKLKGRKKLPLLTPFLNR